jgi:hypothetical protein
MTFIYQEIKFFHGSAPSPFEGLSDGAFDLDFEPFLA